MTTIDRRVGGLEVEGSPGHRCTVHTDSLLVDRRPTDPSLRMATVDQAMANENGNGSIAASEPFLSR